jgi:hypothetical protein
MPVNRRRRLVDPGAAGGTARPAPWALAVATGHGVAGAGVLPDRRRVRPPPAGGRRPASAREPSHPVRRACRRLRGRPLQLRPRRPAGRGSLGSRARSPARAARSRRRGAAGYGDDGIADGRPGRRRCLRHHRRRCHPGVDRARPGATGGGHRGAVDARPAAPAAVAGLGTSPGLHRRRAGLRRPAPGEPRSHTARRRHGWSWPD